MLLGIDTGGTFTDFLLFDRGQIRIHKRPSTPKNPEHAILAGIKEMGLTPQQLTVIHGSTVATNAVLEGKGVKSAYVCNHGMADILTLGRQERPLLYSFNQPLRLPPVPKALCIEVGGRISAQNEELEPLLDNELVQLKQTLREHAPQAVAINLLFSFVNPQYEQQIENAIRDLNIFISRSSDVLPEYGEYERGITTWLNAWIGPIVQRYLAQLESRLAAKKLTIMQSSGGTFSCQHAAHHPVHMLLSGPAGGLKGAQRIGELTHQPRLLTFDMGGTSTDVALINKAPKLTNQGRIGDYPVAIAMVDMHTIGAGGGSIAYLDEGGLLQVGPESAGAEPGPACYGKGGTLPTVSDANLILGRLRSDRFLGGHMRLDESAAHQALLTLSNPLGISIEETAQGIVKIANEHMSQALRVISVQRGIDPRDYTLTCFGGAGGLHVCALADALDMKKALVPVNAGVLSALGMLNAPPARELSKTISKNLEHVSLDELNRYFSELAHQGREALAQEGIAPSQISENFSMDLRYLGQTHCLNLNWMQDLKGCREAFHQRHLNEIGHRLDHSIELVNIRAHIQGPVANITLSELKQSTKGKVYQSNNNETTILNRDQLNRNDIIIGPAIICETVSTTYIAENWQGVIDQFGNILLEPRKISCPRIYSASS